MGIYRILMQLYVLGAMLIFISSASASTYIPLGDDVYTILSRLEAEGIIHSSMLSTRPISRIEAERLLSEAERNSKQGSAFIKSLVQSLRERLSPYVLVPRSDLLARARYNYAGQDGQYLNYNNDGDLYIRGSNSRVGIAAGIENIWRLSGLVEPEWRWGDDRSDIVFKRAYLVFDAGWDIIAGKDSMWWGPGHHGALLLSNNVEPFTMLRIGNPKPVKLPWIFEPLGLFRFTFFSTRLEKERADFPEPYLWGMRLDFKPHPYIEVGLQRTGLLGGAGRPNDLATWFKSLTGSGEHEGGESGDQRAGYHIKITMPFDRQPVQIYTEGAAEDTVGLRPVQWAYIYGIYLPRIAYFERIGFRYEWAETYDRHEPSTWYIHHIYTDGYTYKDRIIGHHMGTNSRDNFMEVTYLIPEKNARLSISYDIEEHAISTPVREKNEETFLRFRQDITPRLSVNAAYGYGRIKNPGNTIANALKENIFTAGAEWRY